MHTVFATGDFVVLCGHPLDRFDPHAPWPRVADTYWAYSTSPSETPQYGRPVEPARVGSYTESMSEEEVQRAEAVTATIPASLRRFLPERFRP